MSGQITGIPKFRTGRAKIYPPRRPAVGIYLPCVILILHLIYEHFQSVNVYLRTIFCRWKIERCARCQVGCISKEITQLFVSLCSWRITRALAPYNDIHSNDVIKWMWWKFLNSKNTCLHYYSIKWFVQRNPVCPCLPVIFYVFWVSLYQVSEIKINII